MKNKIISYLFPILVGILLFNTLFDRKLSAYNVENILHNSTSAYDDIPLICERSFNKVSLVYPDIKKYKDSIRIFLFDGDFNSKKYGLTNGYFYDDRVDKFIVLNKYSKNLEQTLTHELLHYVDYLRGDTYNKWSISNIGDKMLNTTDSFGRMFYITTQREYDKSFEKLKNDKNYQKDYVELEGMINKNIETFESNRDYYTSPEEMFVRVNLLKIKMFEYGIITIGDFGKLEKGLSRDNIHSFINHKTENISEYYDVLYFINWDIECE